MKLFGTVFFIVCCFFLLFIILATTPLDRINRTCLPANWLGVTMTTIGAMVSTRTEDSVREGANTIYDACRFAIYRQFYAADYEAARQAASGTPAPAGEGP